jgi:hypothetical protein
VIRVFLPVDPYLRGDAGGAVLVGRHLGPGARAAPPGPAQRRAQSPTEAKQPIFISSELKIGLFFISAD